MTRAEIVDEITQEINHITNKELDNVLVLLLQTIQDKIVAGETIYFRGFGTFGSKIRKQRVARNMKTGESIKVPEHKVPYFQMGKELKELKMQSKKQNRGLS